MPAARLMPRTRTVRLLDRLGGLLAIAGFLGGALSVYDLVNGKKALAELVVCGVLLLLGIGALWYAARTRADALARDWAAMPPGIRRDLPYGADIYEGVVGFPTKVSAVGILASLGGVCMVLGLYGLATEDARTAVIVVVMMAAFAAFFFGMAWLVHGVKWTADAYGVTRWMWPKRRLAWTSVAEFYADRRGLFVILTGPGRARPRLTINVGLLEVSAGELIEVLRGMRQRA